MRAIPSAIVMSLLAQQALASGLTPSEVKEVNHYWDGMSTCNREDNSQNAADCHEAKALVRHADLAHREGDMLILKMDEGEKTYTDKSEDLDAPSTILLGYLKPIDSFVIFKQYYEWSDAFLLHRKTGKTLDLVSHIIWKEKWGGGLVFSPDGTRMVDYMYSCCSEDGGMRVYDYDREKGFTLTHDGLEPCFTEGDMMHQGRLFMGGLFIDWQNNDTLRLKPKKDMHASPLDVVPFHNKLCSMPRN